VNGHQRTRAAKLVALGGIGGDAHSVGLIILRRFLLRAGYRVRYLATQNSVSDLCDAALTADAVLVSNMDGHAAYYLRGLRELQRECGVRHRLWYLGGHPSITGDREALLGLRRLGFDRVFAGRRLSRSRVLGLFVGLGGVVVLVGPVGSTGVDAVGALACLVAAVSWAGGSVYARGAPLPRDLLLGSSMQMLSAGVFLSVAGLATGEASSVHADSFAVKPVLAFVYLVLVGSLVAFSAYAWLLKNVRISVVATYAFVNPVVAVALGAAFLGERITATTLIAGGAIVTAVVLIVCAKAPVARAKVALRPATLRS